MVVSPSSYNGRVGLALFCPLTNQAKGYPFEVPIPEGLAVTGVVLADQVKNLDWQARKAEWMVALPDVVVAEVLSKLGKLVSR